MTIWLTHAALAKMRVEALALQPLESGGILLGWRRGDDRVVVDVTGPGPLALHGRHRFYPDHTWQCTEICRRFDETGGDIDYLGDWHSHPDGGLEMSGEDHSTLRRIARRVREPLMLIIAGENNEQWTFACWKGEFSGRLLNRRFFAPAQATKVFEPPTDWQATRQREAVV